MATVKASQTAPASPIPIDEELSSLWKTRQVLELERDILALKYEIKQIEDALENGNTGEQGEAI